MAHEQVVDGFLISDARERIDLDIVHAFLARSYWSPGVPRATVEKAAANSMVFGVYRPGDAAQVGYARVITDRATYAYLSDVFILEEYRGRGLSKALIAHILGHPELQGLRRWALLTWDAQGLYEQFGFRHLEDPRRYMERVNRGNAPSSAKASEH
jgi:GNAT superfamily N-acetyltransferase